LFGRGLYANPFSLSEMPRTVERCTAQSWAYVPLSQLPANDHHSGGSSASTSGYNSRSPHSRVEFQSIRTAFANGVYLFDCVGWYGVHWDPSSTGGARIIVYASGILHDMANGNGNLRCPAAPGVFEPIGCG
jgi:hypothetical protein